MATDSGPVFTIPIHGATSGEVVCTRPAAGVYLLTFAYGPDNRLPTPFCDALVLALDLLEHRYADDAKVVVTTSAAARFYSNGMDIDHALTVGPYMHNALYRLFHRLLTFPRPTIAMVNGHAFAGGLMVAMMHDYRVMNPKKGYLCLNELELGMAFLPPMLAIFRVKLSAQTLRKMTLEAHRYNATEALKEGIVDRLGGIEETLAMINESKLTTKSATGMSGLCVYGAIKREAWKEVVAMLEDFPEEARHIENEHRMTEKLEVDSLKRIEEWEAVKSKL